MVTRSFIVNHNSTEFHVEYDTDDGYEVFKFQLFSLTNVPPDEQKIIGWEGDRAVSDDSDLTTISEKLRLVSISKEEDEKSGNSVAACSSGIAQSDEELARMLLAEEEALMLQQFVASANGDEIEKTITPYLEKVLMYEDPERQEAARKTVPVLELEEKALVSLAKEGNFKPSKAEQDHAFLLQLLFWFKQSFRWVNAASCDNCGNQTISHGMGTPLPSEALFGCSRVELYWCQSCSTITRFPRYNDPLKLLETRKGRCGEWANCFTLYCRAFGYESRLILDFTDHLWTECFSHCFGRWMHLDPCEAIFDNPLLYEKGWNKKLNYIIAIAKDGVYDVTKRYTRKWHEILSQRKITTEAALSAVLSNITKDCRKGFTAHVLSSLEERDRDEVEAIERDYHSKDYGSTSLPGRHSGDKGWRISRSEFGSDDNPSLSSSSCPIRMCIDKHVTRIYNAFYPIFCSFILNSLSKSSAVEILKMFRKIVIELRDSPFRMRKASIKRDSSSAEIFVDQMLPSFTELLEALSLKCELGTDGRVAICLAGDPVKTSLALPVLLDGLDDVIHNFNVCDNFSEDSLSLPLVKLNRICSGLVLASGEELPFGIATSVFDGIMNSKWEEPNGAKGCWIIYKVLDNKMQELVAYELMSANDAPERDPMDWVVEGSNDGGCRWNVLDEQSSQRFETRFQRKMVKVNLTGFLSNAFRFRFLKARDVEANSRLQLGSIDLYARGSRICR